MPTSAGLQGPGRNPKGSCRVSGLCRHDRFWGSFLFPVVKRDMCWGDPTALALIISLFPRVHWERQAALLHSRHNTYRSGTFPLCALQRWFYHKESLIPTWSHFSHTWRVCNITLFELWPCDIKLRSLSTPARWFSHLFSPCLSLQSCLLSLCSSHRPAFSSSVFVSKMKAS